MLSTPLLPFGVFHLLRGPNRSAFLSLLLQVPSWWNSRIFCSFLFFFTLGFSSAYFRYEYLVGTQNSPVYANQPSRLGASEMCRTSDTLWDSRLWCWGLGYTIWKVILQPLPEAAPLGQDFKQEKKSLNRKFFLLFILAEISLVPPALNFPENTVRTFPWWDNLSLPFWAWL